MNRVLPLASALNFRDFGGYETRDGRRVRWGRLFRSGVMTQLSDADRATVADLGIRTVCDLRRRGERTRWPNPSFGADVASLHWEGPPEMSPLQALYGRVDIDRAAVREAMIAAYQTFPANLAGRVRLLFGSLAGPQATPLIVHCTVGKDRTGFSVAMLLTALGVPHATVVEDYLLTNRAVDLRERMLGVDSGGLGLTTGDSEVRQWDPAAQQAVFAADADYLDASFATVVATHGSPAGYLRDVTGLDDVALARVREYLLES